MRIIQWMANEMTQTTDESLVTLKFREGDAEAYGELMSRYERLVFAICYRMMGNAEDARDAAQEAFTRAWAERGRFDAARPFKPWLCRIAVNICLNELRRSRRSDVALDEIREPASEADGPQRQLERKELAEKIQAALDRLDPEYRIVIILKYLTGMSYAEIQKALEISQATLEMRLYRARLKLREWLGPVYQEQFDG